MMEVNLMWQNGAIETRELEGADELLVQGFKDYLVRRLPIDFSDELPFLKKVSLTFYTKEHS